MSNDNIPVWIIGRRSVYVEGIIVALAQSKFLISDFFISFDDKEADRLRSDEKILCLINADKTAASLEDADLIANRVREKRPNALIVLVSSTPDLDKPFGDQAKTNLYSAESKLLSIDACIAGEITGNELVSLLQLIFDNGISIKILVRDRSCFPTKIIFSSETNRVSVTEADQNHGYQNSDENSKIRIFDKFSSRERQILQGISDGDTNKVLARKLGISEATVKAHVRTVFRKLGAHNRTQAVRYYFAHRSYPQIALR